MIISGGVVKIRDLKHNKSDRRVIYDVSKC